MINNNIACGNVNNWLQITQTICVKSVDKRS